ncbi:hypothetical protein EDC94DRAFT_646025 [Helicostylum pulchrum]|nr:hypothetical protein EDC94DRAFT_646025 [Helicostylum pulchrum]
MPDKIKHSQSLMQNKIKRHISCVFGANSNIRPTAKIQNLPNKDASVTFKNIFITATAINESTNNYILALLEFQFDREYDRITTFLDDTNSTEKDKKSDSYKVSRVATQRTAALSGEEDEGRKIVIMAKSKYGNVLLELCSIKFKVQGADDTTFMRQQSKNIRTNICILDKINNIKKKLKYILYMDRKALERLRMRKNLVIRLNNESKLVVHLEESRYVITEYYYCY